MVYARISNVRTCKGVQVRILPGPLIGGVTQSKLGLKEKISCSCMENKMIHWPLRVAMPHELEKIGAEFIYQCEAPRHHSPGAPCVKIIGFTPLYTGDSKEHTLCVVKHSDGHIILATDEQLFVDKRAG